MSVKEPCTASVLMTVQTVTVCTAPGLLTNIMLHPGSAASTLTVYDNASAGSGTVLALLQGVANGATVIFPFDTPVFCKNGITCVTAGTGAQSQAYFQRWG